ncbi:MAG: phosphoserine transaminase [Cellvibrionaceae bacterium]|nr:phosphoserine transaminase [Cellvibrionaceae bacterium]
MVLAQPDIKPRNPNFSSGPCSKRPGYDVNRLQLNTLGRSHRADVGQHALQSVCTETADLLGLPEGYRVGLVPGSDTGAVEMALWSLLGARGVDILAWESFGSGWVNDLTEQLKLDDVRIMTADYGDIPDLSAVDFNRDVVFTWNGTTSGVKVPDGDWLLDNRQGLTICDATSAVFAMELPWEKLDVVTFSWQKVLGGEGAHGMIILSPRAVARLESYTPPWPLPKVFRLTKSGKLIEGIFTGATINTPSMLCVADYLDALNWVRELGGVKAAIAKSEQNLALIRQFVADNDWINFLAQDEKTVSNTSVCLRVDAEASQIKAMVTLLSEAEAAYDIGAYRDAPSGLRIWCGATVALSDLQALLPWLSWAYQKVVVPSIA